MEEPNLVSVTYWAILRQESCTEPVILRVLCKKPIESITFIWKAGQVARHFPHWWFIGARRDSGKVNAAARTVMM